MTRSSRRANDAERHADAIAKAQGWTLERRAGAGSQHGSEEPKTRAAFVVSGGDLRDPALLVVATATEGDRGERGAARPRVVSEHLPVSLPPPPPRRARATVVTAELVEHLPGGTLDALLSRPRGLAAGEAATVLACVARGLADLHGAGWAAVRLSPSDIGFRDDGCPVLTGADSLRPLDPSTARQDVDAFAALAGTTCAAVAGAAGADLLAAATARGHTGWHDVVSAVVGSADPLAVSPVRSAGDAAAVRVDEPERREAAALRIVERALEGWGERPLARGWAAARAWIRGRPLLAVIAAVPLVVVLVILIALPGGPLDEEGRSTQNRPAPREPGDSAVVG